MSFPCGYSFRLHVFLLLCCAAPLTACAAKGDTPQFPLVSYRGQIPDSGRVVIRSGLAWLDEQAPIFQLLAVALQTSLEAKGLLVTPASPSALEKKPLTPLPKGAGALVAPQTRPLPKAAQDEAAMQAKTAQLAREGKLPKVTLRKYAVSGKDSELPGTVLDVAPPDVERALFAFSQERGLPVLRGGINIPGRLPAEMRAQDFEIADYAVIVRFAHIQPVPISSGGGGGGMSGSSGIGGVGSLGFAPPAPGGYAGTNYGTPGGYIRGYEGMSPYPGDFWGRDHDFKARDYTFRTGPPPQYATPPDGGRAGEKPGSGLAAPVPYDFAISQAWELLLMECYDLAPARNGAAPRRIWQAAVQQPAGKKGLAAALPDMVHAAVAPKDEKE